MGVAGAAALAGLVAMACGTGGGSDTAGTGTDSAAGTAGTRPRTATTAFPTAPIGEPPPHVAAPAASPVATWAAGHVEAWWEETFPTLTGRAYQPVRGPVGAWGVAADGSACAAPGEPTGVAAHCPIDDSVLWDAGFVTAVGAEHGRLGVGLLVAHEWAHVAQARGLSWGDRDMEDQADCLAGAWARRAAADGVLDGPVDEAAVAGVQGALVDRASDGTHGHRDREARAASAGDGWSGGPGACAPTVGPPSGGDQP